MGQTGAMSEGASGHVVIGGRAQPGRGRELWRRRGLLWSFLLRELQVRYRQAFLGFAWAVLQPVALTVVAALIVQRVGVVETGGPPYALFVFTALVPWTYFQTALFGAVPTLVSNSQLVRKIWFPREALPLATVLAVGLDLLIAWTIWIAWLAVAGAHVGPALLWSPLALGILVAFTAALSLFGAGVNVRFRDVKHALPVLLQAFLFACPVLYATTAVPEAWQAVFAANPLATVIDILRDAGLHGRPPDLARTARGALVALGLLALAYRYYTRVDRHFADIV